MNPDQIRNVATGFLNVLRNHDDVYAAWEKIASSGDYAAIGALVQNAMHLATTPTKADLDAMDAYIGSNLDDDKVAFADARPGADASMTVCGVAGEEG
jgi:hypothetical protein